MHDSTAHLAIIGETLDGLGIALCAFDDGDRALVWNRTFLEFFPEHAAQTQSPFSFEHLGSGLSVSSLPMPGLGRVCIWKREDSTTGTPSHPTGARLLDITVMKRQQQELIEAERRSSASKLLLEQTLHRMEQGIMMVNADRVVEVCNRRAMELLGLPAALMESKPTFSEVLAYQWSTNEFIRTTSDLQEFVRAGGILDKAQLYERERPNGQVLEIHSVPIAGGGVLRTYTDITERKKNEERMRFVSRHDGLTSLVNREVFLEHLAGASARCSRNDERFAVHFIDLDRFKPVNDEFGHAVGDQVLRNVADRLRGVVRESDVVARLGGDEFAILQRQVESPLDADGLAGRVLEGISMQMQIEGNVVRIGASIGIAHFPLSGDDPDALLRSADAAMYLAKADGRDRFRTHAARHR